jgi:hypothetical protein
MNRFPTVRNAKEYLVSQILAQADRDGVVLTDIERKMLYFSETGWTLPDMKAVSEEFDQSYDQDEYEKKIGQIVQRLRSKPESEQRELWDEAVNRLRDEDHYLQVLIQGASRETDKFSQRDKVLVVLAAVVVLAVMFPMMSFIYSHIGDPRIAKLISAGMFLALVVLVSVVATWWSRDSA